VLPPNALEDVPTATGRRRNKPDSVRLVDLAHKKAIGRFELVREIARGGMGQVFLGRDTKLGRKVAIKFVLRDDKHFLQRFLVEARATARCTHENIVTIFEVGEHDGLPYMVLEYLEGKTLSDIIDAKPSMRQFVELVVPVVRALERAHEHGIIHRDLKPSNIFVTERGQVKVLDFGVARLLDRSVPEPHHAVDPDSTEDPEDSSETFSSNSRVGTIPYMSPEQWGIGTVDHQSDLWAIGIMCWRALTGVHPAGTMSADKLRERVCDLDTPLPSIATRADKLPGQLVSIVDRCLAKRKSERYESASQLLADLQAFLVPGAQRSTESCPFPGLAAFTEEDAGHFFGRSNEIRSALAHLEAWPLLAVIGPSGVGKSSFVHAGIVPAIRSDGDAWQVHAMRPGRTPLRSLTTVLEAIGATCDQAQLREAPGLFGTLLRDAAAKQATKILIVVDQLEELFTLCDDDETRRAFLAALLAAADDSSSPVRVVLSMRADFLDRLAAHKRFLAELSRGLFFLTSPDSDNLREALERPAALAGYTFESTTIVEDMIQVATSRGALPLLSFAAARLWDSRDRERKLLTGDAYHKMGGIVGAFARHADQIVASVPTQSQNLLRMICTRLVTPEGTRALVDRDELLSLAPGTDQVEQILDQLLRSRLIHVHSGQDQLATVEIVHETLITEWPTLKRWLDDNHAQRAFLHELRQAARQWYGRGQPDDLVWRGATAREALARDLRELSGVEQEFLAAIARGVARARRRKALVFTTIVGVLALAIAGGSIALVRIKLAEGTAQDKAVQAEVERQAAVDARTELQRKVDALEAEKRAREAAVQDKLAEEGRRKEAEQTLATSQQLSRDQLETANRELQKQVNEEVAARKREEAARADATKAKAEAEALYQKELAARQAAESELKRAGLARTLKGPEQR
jgi:serine/threonine protein kinase